MCGYPYKQAIFRPWCHKMAVRLVGYDIMAVRDWLDAVPLQVTIFIHKYIRINKLKLPAKRTGLNRMWNWSWFFTLAFGYSRLAFFLYGLLAQIFQTGFKCTHQTAPSGILSVFVGKMFIIYLPIHRCVSRLINIWIAINQVGRFICTLIFGEAPPGPGWEIDNWHSPQLAFYTKSIKKRSNLNVLRNFFLMGAVCSLLTF